MRSHLRQRGDAWELRVYAGKDPVSGRRLYRTRTVRGGKRAAEDAFARLVTEVAGILPTARDATVGELVSEWFELAKADLSPSTVRGYEVSIRCYIAPALGDVRLDLLRAAQLDQLYARMRAGQHPAQARSPPPRSAWCTPSSVGRCSRASSGAGFRATPR